MCYWANIFAKGFNESPFQALALIRRPWPISWHWVWNCCGEFHVCLNKLTPRPDKEQFSAYAELYAELIICNKWNQEDFRRNLCSQWTVASLDRNIGPKLLMYLLQKIKIYDIQAIFLKPMCHGESEGFIVTIIGICLSKFSITFMPWKLKKCKVQPCTFDLLYLYVHMRYRINSCNKMTANNSL